MPSYASLLFCFLLTILHAAAYLIDDTNTTAHGLRFSAGWGQFGALSDESLLLGNEPVNSQPCYNGTFTSDKCTLSYTFTGSSTALYALLAAPYGVNASISLDARAPSMHVLFPPLPLNASAAGAVAYNKTLYSVAGLAPGPHTLSLALLDWMGGASGVGIDYAGVDEELLAAGAAASSSSNADERGAAPGAHQPRRRRRRQRHVHRALVAHDQHHHHRRRRRGRHPPPRQRVRARALPPQAGRAAEPPRPAQRADFEWQFPANGKGKGQGKGKGKERDLEDGGGEDTEGEGSVADVSVRAFHVSAFPSSAGRGSDAGSSASASVNSSFQFEPRARAAAGGGGRPTPQIVIMTSTETRLALHPRSPPAPPSPSTTRPRHPSPAEPAEPTGYAGPAEHPGPGPRAVSASAKVNARVLQWMAGAGIVHPLHPRSPSRSPTAPAAAPIPAAGRRESLPPVLPALRVDQDDAFGAGGGELGDGAEAPPQYEWLAI
ncbi:hypothetical protein FIBSPDRAFT_938352 [Athelia psychrophila]|uniref:Lytic polysaccharide monooxygenase n=1 Tax=Athelia psychrophila TaxID=1759441 RepID=A0A165YQC8_9AGAM|nr:hypothetical protein FIBSPDRAFT_938352 [Fibularhizoctonia sp. CBS 109695]